MGFLLCKSRPTVPFYTAQIIGLSLIVLMCIVFYSRREPEFTGSVLQSLPERNESEQFNPKQLLDFQSELTTGIIPQPVPEYRNYSVYVNNLLKCIDTTNLTNYFHQENLIETAALNVKKYLDAIRKFIPANFNSELSYHCWNSAARLSIGTTVVSGHINGNEFRIDRENIKKWTLNTIPRFPDHHGQREYFQPISCIPELFLLGFHKCGSTYVFSLLNVHPKFHSAIRKEPGWFIGRKHDFMDESAQQSMYFADYLLNFEPLITKNEPALIVDGSVGMMLDWPDFNQQQRITNYCLLPSVFPQVLPRAKFIVVMRDPLLMLYSSFWFSYTLLREDVPSREAQLKAPTLFHDKIVKKIGDIKSCIEVFPLAKCLVESSPTSELLTNAVPQDHGVVSIYESVYYIHIQKWLSVVPRERFLFLTLEEFSTNLERTANDIWNFLGVNSLDNIEERLEQHIDTNRQKIIDYQHDPDLAMRNDTKKLLRDFLHPYNRMLAELLGDRKFLWGD